MLNSDNDNRSRRSVLRSLLTLASGLLLILGVFVGGEFAQRVVAYQEGWGSGAPAAAATHMGLNLFHKVPRPLDDAQLEHAGLLVYELRIPLDELRTLRRVADQVVAAGDSTGIAHDYVPAQFLLDGEWLDIEVKLCGKTRTHYHRYRPSMRLKFPANRLLDGKQMINLCPPHDKGVTMDLTTNWELSRHGIVTWDSRFVVLKVNDDVIGVFQEVEQFGRAMLDRAGRSEGFIFSGSGQLYGKEEGFAWDKARPAIRWLLACKDQGALPPDAGSCTWRHLQEYLDTDLFAWGAAQATLLGSAPSWSSDKTRVYYDPARGKFEPIPWDYKGYLIDPAKSPEGETCKLHGSAFLRVPEFRRMRDERLWVQMTTRMQPMLDHADELWAELEDVFPLDHRSPKYWREQQIHQSFREILQHNSEYLTSLYQRHDLRATVCKNDPAALLELENHGKAFVTVSGILLRQGGELTRVTLDEPLLVDGIWMGEPGRAHVDLTQHASCARSIAGDVELVGLIARNNITGAEFADQEIQIVSGPATDTPVASEQTPPPSEPLEMPANVRLAGSELLLGPEPVQLDSTWEIPRDYSVKLLPGLNLSLDDGASLIVYGDLSAVGTREKPIKISGAVSQHGWGALVVQGTRIAPSHVRLEHTTIAGGSGAQNARSHFTGAFSVTDGVVSLRDCRFVEGAAIDGINLKYCEVDMHRNLVSGTVDDAVDLDFCKGIVVGNRVENSGGDGLDFSGSDLLVQQNAIENCADKGISVGEQTVARLENNAILHCYTGVASKDGSQVNMQSTGLAHLEVGIALYREQLTFGQPSACVEGVVMIDVGSALLRCPGSVVNLSESARYAASPTCLPTSAKLEFLRLEHALSRHELKALLLAKRNDPSSWGIMRQDQLPW